MDATVEWVDARERLPEDGIPVAAATSGTYPAGEAFWIVLPMRFAAHYVAADGTEYRDCFVDSDLVVRLPHGRPGKEHVTHWAMLPPLPGLTVRQVLGTSYPAAAKACSSRGR
ncbi:AQJ64_40280 family protein [Amycolatopsis silviterrae]|uniref:AQJ64_40280 family protein n=1 Tax=Amycolatopsis silviterrae TaxID=1656914 RepID=A0ABW5H6T6_9PSEU